MLNQTDPMIINEIGKCLVKFALIERAKNKVSKEAYSYSEPFICPKFYI